MLLGFIGDRIEEVDLRELLGTDEYGGTPALNILALNASLSGVKAEIHYWSLVDLQDYLETKRHPCIVAVRTNSLPQRILFSRKATWLSGARRTRKIIFVLKILKMF